MNEEWSRIAAGSIQHEALMARLAFEQTLYPYQEPSAIYRPSLGIDGNKWCALYGEDLMHGVAGFGDSPELAMADFNRRWRAKLPPQGDQMKLITVGELEAAWDSVEPFADWRKRARAIERIATQRALEAAAEVCSEWSFSEECQTAIRAMAKEVGV